MPSFIKKKNLYRRFQEFNERVWIASQMDFDIVPDIMSDKEIRELIDRMSDKDIDRIRKAFRKSEKHDIGEVSFVADGMSQPTFMRVLIDDLVNYINSQRSDLRSASLQGIESPVWIGTKIGGKNLEELKGSYYTAEDLTALWDTSIADYDNFLNMYVAVMVENGFSEDTINQVVDIYSKDPIRFRQIMESNSDEVELNYIYVSADYGSAQYVYTNTGVHKIGVSADQTEFSNRMGNVERFWLQRHLEYEHGVPVFEYAKGH